MIVNQMTNVRANFMAAFLAARGRVATVTRPELLAFSASWAPAEKGPGGFELRFPSWLTADDYRVKNDKGEPIRGSFTLPWAEYDAFVAAETAATEAANAAAATKAAEKLRKADARKEKAANDAAARATKKARS